MQLLTPPVKPFLKWAGGKTQLLPQMYRYFPAELKYGLIKKYAEPFLGGGAVFFHVAQNYDIEEFFVADINIELYLVYKVIANDVEALIDQLEAWQHHYYCLSPEHQKEYFYQIRTAFNNARPTISFDHYQANWIERAAQIIFLNRTCFNGLFRVNSKAEFNVPFGKYDNPSILGADNLRTVANLLQRVEIRHGDFSQCESFVDANTFVYFDPPYRPISKTATFTSYSQASFDDSEQLRLAAFYQQQHLKGARLMLSNSDPHNEDPHDNFFEQAYQNFRIERVRATRMINSVASKRGEINELLILNY